MSAEKHRRVWVLALLVWTALLLVPIPDLSDFFDFFGFDDNGGDLKFYLAKTLHFVAYAFLANLAGKLEMPARYRWTLLYVLMAHASITELLQLQLTEFDRRGNVKDIAIDHVGVLAGLLYGWKRWTRP